MSESASFLATLPPLLSALRVSGDGGCRVMFDIPESEMGEALKLVLWRQMVLKVTITPEQPDKTDDTRGRTESHY